MSKKYNKDYFKRLREESSKSYYNVPALNWGELTDGKYVIENRYDFQWKVAKGEKKHLVPLDIDLYEYIKQFQHDNNMAGRRVDAFVGTDSQNHLSYTRFVTVICLQIERNGVHVLVHRMDLPKIYDYRYRLLKETDISAEFARNNKAFFNSIGMPLTIHADYNCNENLKSNGVVAEASNYLKTIGFNLQIKNNSWSATYAADYFC
jgi:predicted RNase H-related nuclease YkuK (DUF458 family)